MFAFAESLKRQEIKSISPNANISLLSITISIHHVGTDLWRHATALELIFCSCRTTHNQLFA